MKIYDVTVPISAMVPIYSGDPAVSIDSPKTIAAGDAANVSHLCFGAHTGTHVDAPNHFIEGTRRVDQLEMDKLVGPCIVVEIADEFDAIDRDHLPDITGIERILFKTRNSKFWDTPKNGFRTDFTYLSPEAARILAHSSIKLVGIDYLSIEKFASTDFAAHITLLKKEVVILEGLDLRGVMPGEYEIICLPLKYIGGTGDGAPARTILRQKHDR
ncbi:MAG TPA: cyclase family protein [Pyrinomonadaceae bacterium]|nr:cyclase family protein [Pyrinomonadaceae bacterium]